MRITKSIPPKAPGLRSTGTPPAKRSQTDMDLIPRP